MTDLARFAVFGLLDEATSCLVRVLQHRLVERTGNRTILFFPVHVTIRGRFWAKPRNAVAAFHRFVESEAWEPVPILLSGPVFRLPDLAWFQIDKETPAFKELVGLHLEAAASILPAIELDEFFPQYAGEAFCPHVTLGWGCSEEDLIAVSQTQSNLEIKGQIVSLALAKYPPGWPVVEDLVIVDFASLKTNR